ncbi:hypothetical protein IMG5_170140 [Ichthyophthirius multifiliis]|uniref:Tetratricopeptide repeat protein n=1 Tax=Ichthyophthirius multifiliis TaxID=5932 RepID=G0R1F7_ICHMU|nr:hypothetical protein IMG5_170140 [Ichthyophthirius multifiliis]EGR28714.1 hypothetical protein IMG5_170140 [Ichthyophthirius multifiliis]|eukprot:XP_004029950.1 hypothetical protein IMG5_170140 [Ichthyophthirius multifiliis]
MEEEITNQQQTNQNQLIKQLVEAIEENLRNHFPQNAVFLAERLLAEHDNEDTRSILAECYMAENKHYKVYEILKNCKSEINRYKFALVCLKLNKYQDGEKALLDFQNDFIFSQKSKGNNLENIPNGAYGYYLLGLIFEGQQKFAEAKEQFIKSLDLNPTLWVAYEKLCKIGDQESLPIKVFCEGKYRQYLLNKKSQPSNIFQKVLNDPRPLEVQSEQEIQNIPQNKTKMQAQIYQMIIQLQGQQAPQDPQQQQQQQQLYQPNNQQLFTQLLQNQQQIYSQTQKLSTEHYQKDLISLLRSLGEAFYHMSLYMCKEAIDYFNKLPRNHYNTGWVLANIGRCYMEIVKYSEAEKMYAEALRIEPYRLEGIEYYSSCLWHLKKQVELCYLAQQALEKSVFAPETWIAVGNCFSLQKEHENALKFFTRAIQLNPQSAYAHSLCGHEFVYNEDFGKARKSFQSALNLDMRNYNAWWGLGNILYKQEKYQRAAESFQHAININPKNPVLYSFMGMTLAADRNFKKALSFFEISEKLDPKNGLNKFQKANTLVKLENYEAALKELEELYKMMPKEAPIPMLMGKVYKKLKKTDKALNYFTLALDLEGKDSQRIKALIESLHQENQDFVEDLEL